MSNECSPWNHQVIKIFDIKIKKINYKFLRIIFIILAQQIYKDHQDFEFQRFDDDIEFFQFHKHQTYS